MAGEKPDEIGHLLQEGLDHYGTGGLEEAVRCWRRVLELAPGHVEAQEYLQTALGEGGDDGEAGETSQTAEEGLLAEAQHLLQADDLEAALELLETLVSRNPEHLAVHGYIDMVHAQLLKGYRERVREGVPRALLPSAQVLRFNLPPDAGFLLSLVDGRTSVKDLISVSGMDEFRCRRILVRLMDAGVVGIAS